MKIKEVIRKKQNRLKKSLLGVLAVSAATVSLFPQTVMASGVSDVTQPLMNLKTLVISIIGAVGVIILAKNVMEFAQISSTDFYSNAIRCQLLRPAIGHCITSRRPDWLCQSSARYGFYRTKSHLVRGHPLIPRIK